MSNRTHERIRRTTSICLGIAALALVGLPAVADNDPDCRGPDNPPGCGVHNMMLVGTKTPYL